MSRYLIALVALLPFWAHAHDNNFTVSNAKVLAVTYTEGALAAIVAGEFQWRQQSPVHVTQLVLVSTRDPKVEPPVTHWKPWVSWFTGAQKSHRTVTIYGLAQGPQKIDDEIKVLYCDDMGLEPR